MSGAFREYFDALMTTARPARWPTDKASMEAATRLAKEPEHVPVATLPCPPEPSVGRPFRYAKDRTRLDQLDAIALEAHEALEEWADHNPVFPIPEPIREKARARAATYAERQMIRARNRPPNKSRRSV